MRKLRKVAVPAVAVICAVALAGCGQSSTSSGRIGDTLTVASQAPVTTFDPVMLDVGPGLLYWQAVYDTLLHLDANRNPTPGLATSFRFDASSTSLTLELRHAVTFSDGTAFDAAAVKANLDRFKSIGGANQTMAASVTSVEVVNPDRVVLHLSAPDPTLLQNLGSAFGAMASPRALVSGAIAQRPVGSGPYRYDAGESQPGAAQFTRSDGYWDKADFPFENLKIVALSDPTTIRNGLQARQLDAGPIGANQIESLHAAGMSIVKSTASWSGLILADRDGSVQPALGKVEVRQAINLVLDRSLFSATLLPGNPPQTDQIFARSSDAFDPTSDNRYALDVAKARSLMAEAGYPQGFTVTMPDLTVFAGTPALNSALDQELGAIGIKITWEQVPPVQLLSAMQQGKYPMFFMALNMQAPWQDIQQSVLPSSPWNPFHVSDPELNGLIGAAQYAAQGPARDTAFQAVSRWLVANAWYAPIVTPVSAWATAPGVQIEPQTQGATPDLIRFRRTGN